MTPVIQILNHARYRGPEFDGNIVQQLIPAMQQFVGLLNKAWGVDAIIGKAPSNPKCWRMVFLDDADQADALGYHQFYRGLPLAKIFVKTCLENKSSISVCATHELAEMLVDPDASQSVLGSYKNKPALYAKEVCDAVEETDFAINGLAMSNFVLPAWFEGKIAHPPGTRYDYLGLLMRPFQLLKGGYCPIQINGRWTQIFGSRPKERHWKKENRRGHRNETLRHA